MQSHDGEMTPTEIEARLTAMRKYFGLRDTDIIAYAEHPTTWPVPPTGQDLSAAELHAWLIYLGRYDLLRALIGVTS